MALTYFRVWKMRGRCNKTRSNGGGAGRKEIHQIDREAIVRIRTRISG